MTFAGTILVVDDHINLAENLAEILEGMGHAVAVADSAETGLARIEQGGIVALITDYRLPGLSGAGLIAELRRQGSDIPAIVISAFDDDETIATSRSAGAFEVLTKPVEIDRLLAVVEGMSSNEGLILLAEDNLALAENLGEVLVSRGYSVQIASNMAEAMAKAPHARAAILDYRLPDGTGVQVAELLTTRDRRTRVLFISGHGEELKGSLQGRLVDAACLEKPLDIARLLDWVTTAVGHGEPNRPRR